MEIKSFKSQLFKQIIKPDNPSYWSYLYAEILFRLKQLDDHKCPCKKCYMDKHNFEWQLSEIENEGNIEKLFRLEEPGSVGYCGRAELPPRFTLNKPKT